MANNESRMSRLDGLKKSIQDRFPRLKPPEVDRFVDVVIDEVSSRIRNDENLAFLRKNREGKTELTVIRFNINNGNGDDK